MRSCCCGCWARNSVTTEASHKGTRVVRQFLMDTGVSDQDFFFYDGSGMSMDDRIAPRANTQLAGVGGAAALGCGVSRDAASGRRGWDAYQPIPEFAAEGQAVGEDGHAE